MKLLLKCITHDADDNLHWIAGKRTHVEAEFTLDTADLYCTYDQEKFPGMPGVDGPEHEFQVQVYINDLLEDPALTLNDVQ